MKLIRQIRDTMRFFSLPKEQRRVTFYSEGKNYYPHLEGLITELLSNSELTVNYISSGIDDPGLNVVHDRLNTFFIDEGYIRNWVFENIDTELMIMTMPDLHQYQIKRSKHNAHYVYVQHSLVSLHMVYRPGAFDHFDTIFCAGPHHVKEIRAMEKKYSLTRKNLVEHGYARLDAILMQKEQKPTISKGSTQHALIAPTWGEACTIESGVAAKVVDKLLNNGVRVTLRPHPQTIKFAQKQVEAITRKHSLNPLFSFEDNVAGQQSLHDSDYMISDWSGAALDYAFGLAKPVIFVDVPKKINNPDYIDLDIEPFESSIRNIIGRIATIDDDFSSINSQNIPTEFNADNYVFNRKKSAQVGALWIESYIGMKNA
ncbi:hypothetical protein SIN8267_02127 [Sinobacterium norvegicum]|uniref:CDP-glycerol:poly(Glycerophosphate) glycerophosphotransferase n=1 Tax=Sinobacterium norvegicum TaxID=1641715 RepID=A0ABN8EI29_9GAMM|nr:CDP-glycerol glycerophosphotransferase family protein [Sinobacterium norvegicum]CAH0992012.1 hypothetical protein SIN8267_02127 [Sinobacterium norvegicum]